MANYRMLSYSDMKMQFDTDQNNIVSRNRSSQNNRPTGLVAFVINNSGGKITTKLVAEKFLLIGCGVIILLTIIFNVAGSDQSANFNPNIDQATGDLLPGEL